MTAGQEWTRRAVTASLTAAAIGAALGKPRRLPSERLRFADPATEFQLLRLTNPAYNSFLPAYWNRAAARRGGFLLFWSDRTGSPQPYRMDLKSGEFEQAGAMQDFDGASFSLLPDDRSYCCFDGASLRIVRLSNFKQKEIYRLPDGIRRGRGFSMTPAGSHALAVEVRDGTWQLRMIPLEKGGATTVLSSPEPLELPLCSPRGDTILYRRADALWRVRCDGSENLKLALAPGRTGPAFWSPSGDSVLYLNFPEERGKLNSIREFGLSDGADRLISVTTQYIHFTPNADASVFVGASGSAASPYLLLLLRMTRREVTLCEHRAAEPARVTPVFSPDSQSIFFQSDRHGKPAIYSAPVAALVERTGM